MAKYDVIYSLGCNCAAAEYLRKYGLRCAAGPFDWIAAENGYAPWETILDRFQHFLVLEKLEKCSNQTAGSENCLYRHSQTGYVFYHDFTWNAPFEEQLPAVLQKYRRRAGRFLADLESSKRVLLVWYGESGITLEKVRLEYYTKCLRQKYGKHIDTLVLQYAKTEQNPQIITEDGLSVYQWPDNHIKNRQDGFLLWDRDTLGPVFASLWLSKSFLFRIRQKLVNMAVHVAAWFIFNRSARHQFVEKYTKA